LLSINGRQTAPSLRYLANTFEQPAKVNINSWALRA